MRIFTSINSGIDADGPHAGGITITITIIIFTTITRGPNVDVTKAMSTLKNQINQNLSKTAPLSTRCLKITEKVSFNIASEASFWKPEACGQTVLQDRSILIGQNLAESTKIEKFKWDILSDFQTLSNQ